MSEFTSIKDVANTIKVPNTPAPKVELCWVQAPTMERCDRRKGHSGKHTWEYATS